MADITLVKFAGYSTALKVMDAKSKYHYGVLHEGSSSGFGSNNDSLAIHLRAGADPGTAEAILGAIEKPTVEFSLLKITTNVGDYVVNDIYDVTSDGSEKKFVLISVLMDDTSGALEIVAFERLESTELYGDVPAGKTLVSHLKEFSVEIDSTILSQVQNLIG